jgi:diguanylate cyclase (GGDEF)-like protein
MMTNGKELSRGPARSALASARAIYRYQALWESLSISVAALCAVGAGIFGLWATSTSTIKEDFRHYVISLAETAAALVDPSLHDTIRRPGQLNDPNYKRAVEPLRQMRKAVADIHFIYTVVFEASTTRFVLDAADPDAKTPDGHQEQSGVWEVYEESTIRLASDGAKIERRDSPMLQALGFNGERGVATALDQPVSDNWGQFMSGFAPIFDVTGRQIGAVGVDVDASVYIARLARARNWSLFGLAPASILIGLLGIIFYHVRVRGLADAQAAIDSAEALVDAARRDKLTGLANRALFMERLHTAIARVHCGEQALFAVLFLDFDRFKLVNDTWGHEAGDELLRRIANRLRAALGVTDTAEPKETDNVVARFGGDEFLVLINDSTMPADIDAIVERLLAALAPAYDIFGTDVHSTASIGIVTSKQDQTTAENIVRNADVAMYEAKRSGRARAVIFNEVMHTRLTRKVAIESSLHKAIGTDQLTLVFQPIIDLDSGGLISAEALLRWNHPELGAISPTEFIPIAEESELIATLGQWVLEEASRAFVRWHALDPRRAPPSVSVNISRAELARGSRLVKQILDTLARVGMDPSCLQLEVAEREVMCNPEASLELMRELRRQGVMLAMDGFGTGTSSLKILHDYPFNTIKIDRSYIKDVNANPDLLAVIHATVTLIENLGMVSLAEGVEDPAQLAMLQSLGCRCAQGILFGYPVEADQLMDACWRPGDAAKLRMTSEDGLPRQGNHSLKLA